MTKAGFRGIINADIQPIVKLCFTIDNRAAGMRALIAAAKIFDFYGSPRRAGSQYSPKRCFFGGEAPEKTDLINIIV